MFLDNMDDQQAESVELWSTSALRKDMIARLMLLVLIQPTGSRVVVKTTSEMKAQISSRNLEKFVSEVRKLLENFLLNQFFPATIPDPPECEVSDPMSCDQRKQEVCIFVENNYKCRCANGYSRLPDGRCVVINECSQPKLNSCGKNSECIDLVRLENKH